MIVQRSFLLFVILSLHTVSLNSSWQLFFSRHARKSTLQSSSSYERFSHCLSMTNPSSTPTDSSPWQSKALRYFTLLTVLTSTFTTVTTNDSPLLARDLAPTPSESQSLDYLSSKASPSLRSSKDSLNPFNEADRARFVKGVEKARPLLSDEYTIEFPKEQLGIRFKENQFEGYPIVVIKEILDSQLSLKYRELLPEAVVAEVNKEYVGGLPLKTIVQKIKNAPRPLEIRFRDPTRFFLLIDSTLPNPPKVVSTSFLPANVLEQGSPEQIIKIERLSLPPEENRKRAATIYDVLEIQYDAEVVDSENTRFVDGSAIRTSPGSSKKSIYYILGEQNGPPGKLPKGWDIALKGMVVGEVRRITLPYVLAYGITGNKELNIPPRSDVIYTVKLISLT